jgi:glycosyltransferase involved in cell wall biosynthesis
LAQLRTSPFARCRIAVLDNCSTDRTPDVCRDYGTEFADLRVIRHRKNIGACPNYLRAVELSASVYTWVLGDDDRYDFSDCSDVIEAIESERFDLISLGSPGQFDWERGMATTSRELIEKGAFYFGVFTFLSGVMFRTDLYDAECLTKGYRSVLNSYPHFEFITKSVAENFAVYVSRRQVVIRDTHARTLPSSLYGCTIFVNNCRSIEDRKLRRRVVYQVAPTRWWFFKGIAMNILAEKLHHPERVWGHVIDLARTFSADQRFLLFLMWPLIVFPPSVYKAARHIWRTLRGQPPYVNVEPPFDHFRL